MKIWNFRLISQDRLRDILRSRGHTKCTLTDCKHNETVVITLGRQLLNYKMISENYLKVFFSVLVTVVNSLKHCEIDSSLGLKQGIINLILVSEKSCTTCPEQIKL